MNQIILCITRKGEHLLRVTGNITFFCITARPASVMVLRLEMEITNSEIVTGQSATQILTLDHPRSADFGGVKGAIRIGGAIRTEIDKDSFSAEFRVISLHTSYEDAAAAIMREKIERS